MSEVDLIILGRRIDGFSVYGTIRNGTEIEIYQDLNPRSEGRRDIWIDSDDIPLEPVNEITIRGNKTNTEQILTLCEVYVFGKYYIPQYYIQKQ